VSMYYYLKVTVAMYMKPPAAGQGTPEPAGLAEAVIFLMAAGVLLAGLFSKPLLSIAANAARYL